MTAAFTLQRRPTAVAISNDGQLIVLLTPEWRLTAFILTDGTPELTNTFLLDEPATTLALSPDGSLLVASQTHGIELFALNKPSGTALRRKLACEQPSSLEFAQNGRMLLCTNVRSFDATTTIVQAPAQMSEDQLDTSSATLWLSSPLFPSSFGRTTHASFVPGNDESRLFAYDAPAGNFGILDHQKMKFTSSILRAENDQVMSASNTPSLTDDAQLVAIPVSGAGIQIIGMPLDSVSSTLSTDRPPELMVIRNFSDTSGKYNQRWLPLIEKALKTQWVVNNEIDSARMAQRLVVAGSSDTTGKGHEAIAKEPQDSGVLHCIDFGFWTDLAQQTTKIIDLSNIHVECLEDGTMEDDTELALARQSLSSRASDRPRNVPLARSVTSARHRRRSIEKKELKGQGYGEDISPEEQHLDGPYVPSEPRPQGTLQRNRTARAAHRDRPQSMPIGPQMRDPRGGGEIPDESDADNWVPPPPVYAQDPDSELPDELKQSLRPPTPPPKSPNRKSASTPNLLSHQPSPLGESHAETSGKPAVQPRPNAHRPRTLVENARRSVLGHLGLTKKSPQDTLYDIPKDPADEMSIPSSDEAQPLSAKPRQSATMPATNPNRRSFLGRPLSLHTNLFAGDARPPNNRSVSQPLERTVPVPIPVPETPAPPSPAQVARLHRRQTSGSISSLNSESTTAPRAATGAHRRGTSSMSPWSSTLMLNAVPETEGHPKTGHMNGEPGSSKAAAAAAAAERKEPPTRLTEANRDNRVSSRGKTSGSEGRRKSLVQSSRLSAIPSMASLKAFASGGSKGGQKEGVEREKDERQGWRKRLGRWRGMVKRNLESV